MNRRSFLASLFAAPLVWAVDRVAPRRFARALRAKLYAGAIAPMDRSDVKRTGTWAG